MKPRIVLFSWMIALLAVPAVHWALAAEDTSDEKPRRGLIRRENGTTPGYTLISPFASKKTFLLDADGKVVHQWSSRYNPGALAYLLPNGNLLRGIQVGVESQFRGGGISGGLQEISWDGKLLWEFHLASDMFYHHHDIEPLPNGNILMIAWESRGKQDVMDAGRRPEYVADIGLWPEAILEIEPARPYGARVVWEWHVWDHLIQDTNPDLPNFGVVRDHPERVNINADIPPVDPAEAGKEKTKEQIAAERRRRQRTDWLHFNGLDYNAELDQIVVSSHVLSEIWIIDHSTTTEEAAGSTGGRSGKGGDLLYRWGNPQIYGTGTEDDRRLYHQHDPQWVPDGYPGAGNITIFNNGRNRAGGEDYSTVVEIVPPIQEDGNYAIEDGEPFAPIKPKWEYNPDKKDRFFASFISGTHRLANGNTMICSGPDGRAFEVTQEGEIVWEYRNPFAIPNDDQELSDRSYSMFRATRFPIDYPGLKGRKLTALDPQPKTAVDLVAERPKPATSSPGWQPLVNREIGLSRWVNMSGERNGPGFRIQPAGDNVVLTADGESRSLIRSDRMYENVMVEFEWRLTESGSKAAFSVWANPLPAVGAPRPGGITIDISDRENTDIATAHGDILAVYGSQMTPDGRFRQSRGRSLPKEDQFHVRPAGEWNHYRVTALDGAVTLEVNGQLVTGGSRCLPSKGYLCLESQTGEVQFRNLRVWELPVGSHGAGADQTVRMAEPHRALYNGRDLANWKTLSGTWTPDNWILTCSAQEGEIEVPLEKGVSKVFFDFKRRTKPLGGDRLPFRIGDLRFDASAERIKQWNRVLVEISDSEVSVTVGDTRQVLARKRQEEGVLTLVGDGVATEFSNVFARSP